MEVGIKFESLGHEFYLATLTDLYHIVLSCPWAQAACPCGERGPRGAFGADEKKESRPSFGSGVHA